jgi:hypothetical protein
MAWMTFLVTPTFAQTNYVLADYMPNRVGDSLVFDYFSGGIADSLLVAWPDTQLFKRQLAWKRKESTGAFRLETLDEQQGWQVFLIAPSTRRQFVFDSPAQLLPPAVQHGEVYTSEATFTTLDDGRKQGTGRFQFRVTVQGHDSSKTPLRNFGDCLVISTLATRTDSDGRKSGYELKEWYARNFGLVKMAGEAFNIDAKGNRTNIVKAAATIRKAKIGGVSYKWDTP